MSDKWRNGDENLERVQQALSAYFGNFSIWISFLVLMCYASEQTSLCTFIHFSMGLIRNCSHSQVPVNWLKFFLQPVNFIRLLLSTFSKWRELIYLKQSTKLCNIIYTNNKKFRLCFECSLHQLKKQLELDDELLWKCCLREEKVVCISR